MEDIKKNMSAFLLTKDSQNLFSREGDVIYFQLNTKEIYSKLKLQLSQKTHKSQHRPSEKRKRNFTHFIVKKEEIQEGIERVLNER